VGPPGPDHVEEAEDGRGQRVQAAVAHVLARGAVAGQVDGVHSAGARQRLLHEQPGVLVAAVAVDEDDDLVAVTHRRVGDGAAVDLHGRHDRALRLLDLTRGELRLGLGHDLLDLGVGDVGRGNHRDRGSDRGRAVGPGDDAAQHAVGR
jgi:hypothetical protein